MSEPTNTTCPSCGEPVLEGEATQTVMHITVDPDECGPKREHEECFIRGIIGSVGHQRGECSCYGGDKEDPPGMSRRDAARAALALWRENQARGIDRPGPRN